MLNLVAARVYSAHPGVYRRGGTSDNGRIDLIAPRCRGMGRGERGLTRLAADLSPAAGELQGAAGRGDQPGRGHPDGNGAATQRVARACAGRWAADGDSRRISSAPSRICRYWSTRYRRATSRLQFAGLRGIGVAGARRRSANLDQTPGTLNQALSGHQGFLRRNNDADLKQ